MTPLLTLTGPHLEAVLFGLAVALAIGCLIIAR